MTKLRMASSLAQPDGWGNALGVFQFGKNTNLDVAQYGNGQTGVILQGGW